MDTKLALGMDLSQGGVKNFTSEVETMVLRLIENNEFREQLSLECGKHFDGLGKVRVVETLEKISTH